MSKSTGIYPNQTDYGLTHGMWTVLMEINDISGVSNVTWWDVGSFWEKHIDHVNIAGTR